MTTPAPEAIEAAEKAWQDYTGDDQTPVLDEIVVAITAAAPFIAAQAKGEAWDAVIARIDLGTPHMVDEKYVAGANWVRNQIEDVLKPTIEGNSE